MPPFKQGAWGGMLPIMDRRKLTDMNAVEAVNVNLESGTIKPWNETAPVVALPDALQETIFPYRDSWLSWPRHVDVVAGQLSEDQYDRIYYTDGIKPKMRGLVSGVATEYDLGIPAPSAAPTVAAETRTATTWTRQWGYFYEEPDGTKVDEGLLTENSDVIVLTPAKIFQIPTVPAKVTASVSARFIPYFDAYRTSGVLFGRVYPEQSFQAKNSDLWVSGARVSSIVSISGSTATITLGYNTTTRTATQRYRRSRNPRARNNRAPKDDPGYSNIYYTQDRSWVYTFVSIFGEEGPPSEPSRLLAIDPTQQARLTNLDTSVSGVHNIAAIRIYRTVTGDGGTEFAFVDEIEFGEDGYVDIIDDEDTDETLPSLTWFAPPDNLAGLITMPGEFMAGYYGKTVALSEPGYPHAWPDGYQVNLDEDVVCLMASGNTIIAVTTDFVYLIAASNPAAIYVEKIPSPQGAKSSAAKTVIGGAGFYASEDGLVSVQGRTAVVVTKDVISKEQWLAYQPEDMKFEVFDDYLFIIGPVANLLFKFSGQSSQFVKFSGTYAGIYSDPATDSLYFIEGSNVTEWNAGDPREYVWTSGEKVITRPWDMSVARVTAYQYPLQFRLFADNALVMDREVTSDRAFRLPKLRPEKYWAYGLVGSAEVTEVLLGQSMADL